MLTITFMWEETLLGRPLHINKEDLDKGYEEAENHSDLDRLFNDFYREIILENSEEDKIVIPLHYIEDLSPISTDELSRAINSFINLYPIVRDTVHAPHIGSFSREELETARNLFRTLSLTARRAWISLADFLGNERMKDVLAKIFNESMEGKTSGEIATILGYNQ